MLPSVILVTLGLLAQGHQLSRPVRAKDDQSRNALARAAVTPKGSIVQLETDQESLKGPDEDAQRRVRSQTTIFTTIDVVPNAEPEHKSALGPELKNITVLRNHVVLTLDAVRFEIPEAVGGGHFYTRAYNGMIPGPTIRCQPGETLNVTIINNLAWPSPLANAPHWMVAANNSEIQEAGKGVLLPENQSQHGELNHTNFHFHGSHVSPHKPSDDVLFKIAPGESFNYSFKIPANHMPGSFIYHPHAHHATSIQAGGGMFGAIIMEDPEGYLPEVIHGLPELDLVICVINLPMLRRVSTAGQDNLMKVNPPRDDLPIFALVNGDHNPTVTMVDGFFYRFRMFFVADAMTVRMRALSEHAVCDLMLLAKDGVYLNEAPRQVRGIEVASGNRADVAVACRCLDKNVPDCTITFRSGADESQQWPKTEDYSKDNRFMGDAIGVNTYDGVVFTVKIVQTPPDGHVIQDDLPFLPKFIVQRPCYLADLRSVVVPTENQHNVKLDFLSSGMYENIDQARERIPRYIFAMQFDDSLKEPFWHENQSSLATLPLGTVQQFTVTGLNWHPFHLHITPYQLHNLPTETKLAGHGDFSNVQIAQKGYNFENYYMEGDWQDTFFNPSITATIRFQLDTFPGHYVMHCHNLWHEDQGLMAYLNITGEPGTVWPGAQELYPKCVPPGVSLKNKKPNITGCFVE